LILLIQKRDIEPQLRKIPTSVAISRLLRGSHQPPSSWRRDPYGLLEPYETKQGWMSLGYCGRAAALVSAQWSNVRYVHRRFAPEVQ
jgi:hypothetical protein